ncbi:MAG: hypothetical protein ACJ8FP_00740 [Xanthobacteraceae bacterium]
MRVKRSVDGSVPVERVTNSSDNERLMNKNRHRQVAAGLFKIWVAEREIPMAQTSRVNCPATFIPIASITKCRQKGHKPVNSSGEWATGGNAFVIHHGSDNMRAP